MIPFDKYEKEGDYHWKLFHGAPDSAYANHVRFCLAWVLERPVLDIGCGDGLITSLFGDATGIDLSALAVDLAKSHGVNASVGDIYNFRTRSFPAIFLGDVIEHLEKPAEALGRLKHFLSPDGSLYVSTPPKQSTLSPYHYKEYVPSELKTLLMRSGFALAEPILVKPEWAQMYGRFRHVSAKRERSLGHYRSELASVAPPRPMRRAQRPFARTARILH